MTEDIYAAKRKPDIEFKRKIGPASYRTYGHVYWKPFIVYILGRTIIGRKHFR